MNIQKQRPYGPYKDKQIQIVKMKGCDMTYLSYFLPPKYEVNHFRHSNVYNCPAMGQW
jgi:hypothetical protein